MIYAVGDIHGCGYTFEKLIKYIQPTKNDTFILLGDCFDRGLNSYKVYTLIKKLQEKTNLVYIKGNHEKFLIDYFEYPNKSHINWLYNNGGIATIDDFKKHNKSIHLIYERVRQIASYFTIGDYYFVHAGLGTAKNPQSADEDDLLWSRMGSDGDKPTIHGHTPLLKPMIINDGKDINIDTGACRGRTLTALILNLEKDIMTFYSINTDERDIR